MRSIKIGGVTFVDSPYMEGVKVACQTKDNEVAVSPAVLSLIESGDIEELQVIDMRPPDLALPMPIEWKEPDHRRSMRWWSYYG